MPEQTPQKSFEESLAELEEIVSQLEAGEKPLDESLALYERGVGALKHCHGILDKAEKRIRLLVKNGRGEPVIEDAALPVAAGKKSAKAPVLESEPDPDEMETTAESKKSAQQTVDSASAPRQNPNPSVKQKSRTVPGKPNAAGGSLFGSAQ